MRELVVNDVSTCVGCNRCIRVCPVEGANTAFNSEGQIKVKIDPTRCIACGACIQACQHESRDYCDDTERFLSDLQKGVPISMFAAPANRANGENWARLLTWLRQKGVRKIYDVSLGADICTWAHIRFIQKENPASVITQPCPAIVNYVLIHKHELMPYLSPIHSPMLCTAVFMRKYERINDKIAGLSPCIAKAHEFDATREVEYNVTLKKLYEYIKTNNIELPQQPTGFDHPESSLGCIYSMPGGLKENVELYLGKSLRIDKSEGTSVVYKALDGFAQQHRQCLPAIFDVLNCAEGCNLGTGCAHDRDVFEVNTIMDNARRKVLNTMEMDDFDAIYEEFDQVLRLGDFIRNYTPQYIRPYTVTDAQMDKAFESLAKRTDVDKKFNCSACGNDTCHEMAKEVACGLNIPENCIQKERDDIRREHNTVIELSAENLKNIDDIFEDISIIRGLSNDITQYVSHVNTAIEKFNNMAASIDSIAMHINIISLNASIEAARAGQHGKAFSVVAEEIRKLAHSSKSTVSEATNITDQATSSIEGINSMIDRISSEIERAFDKITDISEKTQITLKKTDLSQDESINRGRDSQNAPPASDKTHSEYILACQALPIRTSFSSVNA